MLGIKETTMLKINHAHHFRRTLTGLSLIAAPLVGLISAVSLPKFGSDFRGELAFIAQHPARWMFGSFLLLVSFLLFIPATLGIMHLLRYRSVALGHIGAGLLLLGSFFHGAIIGFALVEVPLATSGIEQPQLLALMEQLFAHPAFSMLLIPFTGFFLGLLTLSAAMWRARITARWVPVCIIAGAGSIFIGPESFDNELMFTFFLLSFGYLGLHILRMSDMQWEQPRIEPIEEDLAPQLAPVR
jgi:hypothetical protein